MLTFLLTRKLERDWSNALKEQSQIWAQKLADDCALKHDPKNINGENLALNYGSGSWGGMKSTEGILSRECFVSQYDRFIQIMWPSNISIVASFS
mmetsp:Transcript_3540/g.6842  ORF Transcript_3540/g.6842 Transcript_3540/m.6842 type:complete len:95 (-) Transcript_3540:2304-2588(-)